MSQKLAQVADEFRQLSESERVEFCWMVGLTPPCDAEANWSKGDFSAVAAQTFARLDAEEEEDGYRMMAADESRETEALEWAEATVGDSSK